MFDNAEEQVKWISKIAILFIFHAVQLCCDSDSSSRDKFVHRCEIHFKAKTTKIEVS
jgi:hypothetical protein